MNTRQKIREAKLAKWASLFQDQAASSLGVRDWCEQNNISIHAFYYWKRLAKEAYVQSVMPDIVPIPIGQCNSLPVVQQTQAPTSSSTITGLHETSERIPQGLLRYSCNGQLPALPYA